jgi:transcriptional regulator with XRE-family HTH domain
MANQPPSPGLRIAKRRHQLHLRQEDLAARLGVSVSTVANWETGKHFPRRYLGRVEEVLGISLTDEEEGRYARPVSDELRRLITEILPDPEDQRYVFGILEGTVKRPNGPTARSPARTEEQGAPARRQRDG